MKTKNEVKVTFSVRTVNSDGSYYIEVDYDDFECTTNINYPSFSRAFRPYDSSWTLQDEINRIIEEVGNFYDRVAELSAFHEVRYLE